ncbi:MAG: hypothetical protein ACHREM_31030 [Polyangiales bacterium]
MNPLAIGAIAGAAGLVFYETQKNTSTPAASTTAAIASGKAALDPGMDRGVAATAGQALQKETDPSVLDQFGALLKAAGFTNTASAMAAQSAKLKSNLTSSATGPQTVTASK